ncbi:MAG: ATP-binding cassette domain-containing protein [Deltaproteobacteria bacterium]|nr:ATP-binding cassette domain-containing protein [Deltaproteobacteria bacterium]
MVRCIDVSKRFGSREVYEGLFLEVYRGEILALLGRSGSGKSVLLKLLLGLMRPDRGAILVNGTDIVQLSERQLADVRRGIGMVFQAGALFDSLTVYDNIAYGLQEHLRWPKARIRDRVREVLEAVDLRGVEDMLPGELSGGMRKRVAVARAIAPGPELLLYDEPTTGLDPATARRVVDLIRSLKQRLGVTSLVVTHDVHSVFRVAERLALIGGGRLAWSGEISEARRNPPAALLRFLGEGEDEEWNPPASSP